MILLDSLLDSNKPIWVRNVHKPRGQIVLAMTDRSGHSQKLVIPPLRHPICLSERITPDVLRNSNSLRELISRRVLNLCSNEEALAYYADNPDARNDVDRAFSQQDYGNSEIRKMRETGNVEQDALLYHKQHDALVAGDSPAGPYALQDNSVDLDADIGVAEADEDSAVQSRVKILIAAISSKEKKAREVRSELESIDLEQADLSYIMSNSQGLVEKYAKQKLSELRNTSSPASVGTVDAEDLDDDDDF